MDWLKMFEQYGLIGLIVGVLFFIVWKMLVWVMAFIKDMTKQHNEERIIWNNTLGKHNDILTKISDSIDRHDERSDERGKFVRDEHKEMIDILKRINGYKE